MIFITGATGRLGREVLKKIPTAIPLVRKPAGLKREVITNFEPDELRKKLKHARVVIHLAGSLNFINEKEIWETNVELTKRIVEASPEKARIIFSSSIAVYGKELAKIPADENTECRPDTIYARSKYEAEKIVAAHNNSVILRIGTMYGPQFEDYFRILRMIKERRMFIIGDGKNRISFVHVEDVARAVKAALRAEPGIYVVAGESIMQEEIYRIAAAALGVEPPKAKMSKGAAMVMGIMEELTAKLFRKTPMLTREHLSILASDRVFDCSKAKKELGFRPRQLREGIETMVRLL